tara:strand:+ start:205 stop:459 length:255 start_codon:yes stop_codon:yes gene_type:complete
MSNIRNKRKPYNHLIGYIFSRKHGTEHLVCFNKHEAGLKADNKYVIALARSENDIVYGPSFTSLPKARDYAKMVTGQNIILDWS